MKLVDLLPGEWHAALGDEAKHLLHKVEEALEDCGVVRPREEDIFRAFRLTSPAAVRVVIVGQDPYPTEGVACGLAFGVREGRAIPPSLRNIIREVQRGESGELRSDLTSWAEQGVLLLNRILTVGERPLSHKGRGWEHFTELVFRYLGYRSAPTVFMLWGRQARSLARLVAGHHRVLEAVHPSPLAGGGFAGCGHFGEANRFLEGEGRGKIGWTDEADRTKQVTKLLQCSHLATSSRVHDSET